MELSWKIFFRIVEMKEKILRVVREEGWVIYKGKFIRLIVDFLVEIF